MLSQQSSTQFYSVMWSTIHGICTELYAVRTKDDSFPVSQSVHWSVKRSMPKFCRKGEKKGMMGLRVS